jgi:hypothetical protein
MVRGWYLCHAAAMNAHKFADGGGNFANEVLVTQRAAVVHVIAIEKGGVCEKERGRVGEEMGTKERKYRRGRGRERTRERKRTTHVRTHA